MIQLTGAMSLSQSTTSGKSKFSHAQRLAYARNHAGSIEQPPRWAWSKRACAGEFDEAISEWYEAGQSAEGAEAPRDTSRCPDCAGTGLREEVRRGQSGRVKCRHPALDQQPAA